MCIRVRTIYICGCQPIRFNLRAKNREKREKDHFFLKFPCDFSLTTSLIPNRNANRAEGVARSKSGGRGRGPVAFICGAAFFGPTPCCRNARTRQAQRLCLFRVRYRVSPALFFITLPFPRRGTPRLSQHATPKCLHGRWLT